MGQTKGSSDRSLRNNSEQWLVAGDNCDHLLVTGIYTLVVRQFNLVVSACFRRRWLFFCSIKLLKGSKKPPNQATNSLSWQHCMESVSSPTSPPHTYAHSIPKQLSCAKELELWQSFPNVRERARLAATVCMENNIHQHLHTTHQSTLSSCGNIRAAISLFTEHDATWLKLQYPLPWLSAEAHLPRFKVWESALTCEIREVAVKQADHIGSSYLPQQIERCQIPQCLACMHAISGDCAVTSQTLSNDTGAVRTITSATDTTYKHPQTQKTSRYKTRQTAISGIRREAFWYLQIEKRGNSFPVHQNNSAERRPSRPSPSLP